MSWLAPINALRWARGNRVKVTSAASAASATLTRLSTPITLSERSDPSCVPIGRTSELVAAARSRAMPADPPSIRADDDAPITTPGSAPRGAGCSRLTRATPP